MPYVTKFKITTLQITKTGQYVHKKITVIKQYK